jgi:hypothetical protein
VACNLAENPYWELRQIKGAAYLTRPFRRGLLATFAHISLLMLLFSYDIVSLCG